MGHRRASGHLVVLIKKCFLKIALLLALTSCQLAYLAESSYYQADLLRKRVPLKYALKHYNLSPQQRERIEMTIQLREFMENKLKLKTNSNFSRYVELDQPYVTYVVSAAPKNELKQHIWHFPIIGTVPYKGFFKKEKAVQEVKKLEAQDLDTNLRGVSAYSTLGWFEDPLLSSMLNMKEHQFISTLIHETVHANLYIKGHSKFNERVASFLGRLGAETYYKNKNKIRELVEILEKESHDELIFSRFISSEIKELKEWYQNHQSNPNLLALRQKRFQAITQKFKETIAPQLQTDSYKNFSDRELNNASLLLMGLYMSDFSEFEIVANHHHRDFQKVFTELKKLEDKENPEKALSQLVAKLTN